MLKIFAVIGCLVCLVIVVALLFIIAYYVLEYLDKREKERICRNIDRAIKRKHIDVEV